MEAALYRKVRALEFKKGLGLGRAGSMKVQETVSLLLTSGSQLHLIC